MNRMMKGLLAATLSVAGLTAASGASAAVVVNIAQVGTSVVATTTGTLNLTGLVVDPGYALDRGVNPSFGYVATGSTAGVLVNGYTGLTGPTAFGAGTTYTEATSGTGISFAINGSGFSTPYVFVPTDYVSGASLAGSSTFASQTFASLGLTTGSYVFRSSADTVTVNIGTVISAVPEPASWAMMILGMGAIGFALRAAKRRSDEKFDAKIKRIAEGMSA